MNFNKTAMTILSCVSMGTTALIAVSAMGLLSYGSLSYSLFFAKEKPLSASENNNANSAIAVPQ